MKNLTKILFLIASLLFLFFISYSQNPDVKRTWHWYFGDGAGIDFSSGKAVADTNGKAFYFEGCSVMSDTAGNLLFYTEGFMVRNRNHNIMPNGDSLMAWGTPRQSSIIIPKPGNDSIYYIFTVDGFEFGGTKGLRYSEVDMSLDGGLGDVTAKNILLFNPNAEILAAVKHANCHDIWIMAHERFSNCFRAYLVTNAGVDTNAVINCIGSAGPYAPYGYIAKFSPDGSKMVTGVPAPHDSINELTDVAAFELYKFNNTSGILSNTITISVDTFFAGACFSPDNSKLYITSLNIVDQWVYQYDLNIWDSSVIVASKKVIEYDPYGVSDFQATPDNRIFVARPYKDTIAIINNPNEAGISCNYVKNGLSLAGKECWIGLPNFIESYFDTSLSTAVSAKFNYLIKNLEVSFINQSVNTTDYYWDFGDGYTDTTTNPIHQYNDFGEYTVCLYANNACGLDSLCSKISIMGFKELSNSDTISIFPNPISTYATVIINPNINIENAKFEIYNLLGQLKKSESIIANQLFIKRDNLSGGVYLIKFIINNITINYKLLIN